MGIVQSRTKYNSWILDVTKVFMLECDNARSKARMTDDVNDWDIYRLKRNDCTARQRRDKKKQRKDLFNKIETENDSAKLFNTVKTLMGVKNVGPPTSLKAGGLAKFKQSEIAEIQSAYYCDKIQNIKSTLPRVNFDPLSTFKKVFSRWQPRGGKPQFSLKTVSVSDIFKIISKMKNSHSFGNDNIDATILKLVAPVISPVIAHIINLSMGTVTFPSRWTIARIIPLLKSKESDKTNPSSYRPVAQLPADYLENCRTLCTVSTS